MKKSILALVMGAWAIGLIAQDSMEQTMEKRAREFHKTIGLAEKEAYKKFMKENYTKEYLEKPLTLKRVVKESDGSNTTSDEKAEPVDNLDAKAGIYEQLHNDFGGATISSLTKKDNKMEMILKSVGLKGKFTFVFNKEKPYLIEGLGIEADMEN